MKLQKICSVFLILLLFVSFFALPLDTKAKTIQQFEEEVEKYTKQLQEKQDKIAKNDAEVAQIKTKIASIERMLRKK